MRKCPICGSDKYQYVSFTEDYWGIVEQHGYCERCGYCIEQVYSPTMEGYMDIKKGFKTRDGYVEKNAKKHRRFRRKCNAPKMEVNPLWVRMM